jgi:hypothetical protein
VIQALEHIVHHPLKLALWLLGEMFLLETPEH